MPIITTFDEDGRPQSTIPFDQDAYARWKAEAARIRRERYANDPQYRASQQASRRASDVRRRVDQKAAADSANSLNRC